MCGVLVKVFLRLLGNVGEISVATFWKAQIDDPSFCDACVGRRARQNIHTRNYAQETKGLRCKIAPLPTISKCREGLSQAVGGDVWTYFHFPAAG